MFLDRIYNHAKDKTVAKFQVAEKGQWSAARVLPIQPAAAEMGDLFTWLETADENIALEVFFTNEKNEFLMFGVRITALTLKEKKTFFREVMTSIAEGDGLEPVLSIVKKALGHAPMLENEPAHLLIGKEVYWREFGSEEIWKRGDPEAMTAHEIRLKALNLVRSFQETALLFAGEIPGMIDTATMVEFEWGIETGQDFQMWFGIPVSVKRNNSPHAPYEFSDELYEQLTRS